MASIKIILALAVLLATLLPVSCTVQAQDYTIDPSRDSLTVTVFYQMNLPADGSRRITPAIAHMALNRGLIQTCTDFPALQKTALVTMTASVEGGALPSDFNRLKTVYRVRGTDSLRYPMEIVDPDTLESQVGVDWEKALATKSLVSSPRQVYSFGDSLYQFPKYNKDRTDTLLVHYFAIDAQLSSATDSVAIAPKYLEKVVSYTCMLLCRTRNLWVAAAQYEEDYYKGMSPVTREGALER